MRPILLLLLSLCLPLAWAAPTAPQPGLAVLLELDGAIGPASSQYLEQGLKKAQERQARLVVLQLDTPGGLDTAMREMIKRILQSPIPVVVYVAPSGARAASAGTYLLYAAHVAAMAPATNLGAATPIALSPMAPRQPSPPRPADKDPEAKPEVAAPDAAERKMINDAVAYIRGLAERRGRNADWAEQAVREGASLSAEQALKLGVIDLMAPDLEQLLKALHGREVELSQGKLTLDTQALSLETITPGWRLQILAVLTNPTVAYLLMLIGIYGLLLEGYSPGAILPGVLGGICLLLALYAFQVLPVNYAGLALIFLGIALIVAEAFAPSFGVLGLGGVVAFVIGSLLLMDSDVPGYGVSLSLIAAIATVAALLMLAMGFLLMKSRRSRVVSGQQGLLLETALALEDFSGEGHVAVHGESWQARSRSPVQRGQRLRIARVDGLTLDVEALPTPPPHTPSNMPPSEDKRS